MSTFDERSEGRRSARSAKLTFALLFAIGGCAAPPEYVNRPASPIAWPAPDAVPRVDLDYAYGGTHDVVRHPGFFGWFGSLLVGEAETRFVSPSGLTLSGDVLWVADPGGACVHRVSLATGEHERITGNDENPFVTPIGVAAMPNGKVFVSDAGTARITVLDPDGVAIRWFGGPDVIERPTGICFDEDRARVLVVDTVGCKIIAFDPEGETIATAGKRGVAAGQFNYPTNLALTSDGHVVVVDSLNYRVQVLTPDFRPVTAFGQVGRGPGDFSSPKGIAVDSHDNVYVVDSMFDNIQIFDLRGQLLLAVASSGHALGQLYLATGIHIDGFDRIYVSDAGNSRIQVMQLQGGSQ